MCNSVLYQIINVKETATWSHGFIRSTHLIGVYSTLFAFAVWFWVCF
uniref:Uncharacterized protein n=1 Tax=Anguilla anguilla TaxID=7936 RepID=A0A0E9WF40_ANGAN